MLIYVKVPLDWATTQNNLAIAYRERIAGDRRENLENAIACYELALQERRQDKVPLEWAATQNNLGIAYRERIAGDRRENLERAIACYELALLEWRQDKVPLYWAMTKHNLGEPYRNRIAGDRRENLEKAISCYELALQERRQDKVPLDWAATQNNLGNVYRERIAGDRRENLERAISCYELALQARRQDEVPLEWAMTHNNLGNAYRERIAGDRRENLERAISCYELALQERRQDKVPLDWAMTHNNLGNAYSERIEGDKGENLERAIACYELALQEWRQDKVPLDWATIQNNLGEAYRNRTEGERRENLEKAIACYELVLQERRQDNVPLDWAATQNNLGIAYFYRIKGERRENLENAIDCYELALQERRQDNVPLDWAATQNNLGLAYSDRIRGEKAENLERVIACYQEALKVRTRKAFPQNHAETLLNLGTTHQRSKQFASAYNTFESAIDTVESLREGIVSGEETKRKQAEEWNKLYSQMVEVCLELSKTTEAIEYVERSKTRNLVEQILNRDLKTIFPAEVATQLEKYRDDIAERQYQIQYGKAENLTALEQHLQQLRQQRNELQNRYLPVGYSFKFDSFQATLDDRTAIIEWYILNDKILAFIVKTQGEVTVWQSQPKDLKAFIDLVSQYLQNYYNQKEKDQWQNSLGEEFKKLASILHIDEILTQIPNHCDQLILIPHRFLHLLPLHALPVTNQDSENSPCLLDLFASGLGYAPSCQLLQQVQKRKRPNFKSLFAIQNPTEDLYQDYEKDLGAVSAIKKQFTDKDILKQANAKKTKIIHYDENTKLFTLNEKLAQAHNIFFFCHGFFNPNSSLDSGLQLADASLSLADIITHFKLNKCRLVTLAACETGIIDSNNVSDEYIGLPYGFLLAGSTNVVSSLWTVSATATALLMIKFYEELQTQSRITVALNTTQRWLRDTTTQGFQTWLKNSKLINELGRAERTQLKIRLNQYFTDKNCGSNTKPFELPFYWSAFFVTGKGV
ncbi:MAG: tetratricopeptide repeat protein [Xenococcus sp. MO_188.B8]|nr:tetratricopeptide repeat protein [Xenococcus sp. MO_188.B8]